MIKHRLVCALVLLALVSASFSGCASPEEKKTAFFNKGKALYEQKNPTMARLELKNAIQIDPEFAQAYYYLALVEMMSGNYRDTAIVLTKAVEVDPKLWDAQLLLGRLYLAAQLYDKAMEKARLIQDAEKDHTGAALLEAAVLMAQNKTKAAAAILRKLEAKNISEPEYVVLKATALGRDGQKTKAEEALKQGIAAHPDAIALYAMLARIYTADKRDQDLVHILRTMIRIDPDSNAHRFALSDALTRQGKPQEADAVIQAMIQEKPDKEDLYLRAAQFYLDRNRREDARTLLTTGKKTIATCYNIHLALASILVSENKNDQAIDILNQALNFDSSPSSKGVIQTKNALATLYMSMNQVDKARQYVDDILKASPGSLEGLYTHGLIGISSNSPMDAVSSFRTLLSQTPDNENAYSLLSKAHMMNRENLLALEVLKQGLQAMPDSDRLKKDLADYNLTSKRYADAEKSYKELLAAHPANPDLLSNLAALYEITGRKDQALKTLARIKETYPLHPTGYLKTAQIHIRSGQLDQAIRELETARKKTPPTAELISLLAKTLSTRKLYDKAIALCDEQIQAGQNADIFTNLKGSILEAAGKQAEALISYEKALALKPLWDLPAHNLARMHLAAGKKDLAEKILTGSLERNPANTSIALFLGNMYETQNRVDKAIDLYRTLLDKDPQNHAVANNLAVLIGETSTSPGDLKKAIALIEEVIKARPGDSLIKDTLGWLHYRAGDYTRAQTALTQALALAPNHPELNYHMGMILFKKGQTALARTHLEKALRTKEPYRGIDEARTTLNQLKTRA